MSASRLAELLATQLPNGVATRARILLRTQDALDRALPSALTGHVRVMQLENGTLSVACESGAVATRLRQQTPAVLASLGKHGVDACAIRISVNPELRARYVPPHEKPGMPSKALEGLAHLNAEIEDGPLKEALDRLLRHHRDR